MNPAKKSAMERTPFNRRLRLHTLRASEILPFYDGVFAVAFTLLAYNLPDQLMHSMATDTLASSLWIYALVGIAICIYWFKLRRLVLIDRWLQPPQLTLVCMALMGVVLLPKLFNLVLKHGAGSGNLIHWTLPQVVNTLCLLFLISLNLISLLYALSLRRRRARPTPDRRTLDGIITTQTAGLGLNLVLMGLELSFTWFDNQYIFILPILLIIEEIITALFRPRAAD